MPNLLLTVENDGAEKLWNYILAYRKMMRKENLSTKKKSSKNNITFMVVPTLEQTKTGRTKNKT